MKLDGCWFSAAVRRAILAAIVGGSPACSKVANELAATSCTTVLATLPAESAVAPDAEPVDPGLHADPESMAREPVFGERGGVAYVLEHDDGFRVMHGGHPGKRYDAVGELVLSADGRRCAYGALSDGEWRVVVDGVEGAAFSAVKGLAFSLAGSHFAHQGMLGERWHLVVDGRLGHGTATRILDLAFSGDGDWIAWVDDADDWDRHGRLAVADVSLGRERTVAYGASRLTLDVDRTRVAAVVSSGSTQRVIAFSFEPPGEVVSGPAYDAVEGVALSSDDRSVSYFATSAGRRVAVVAGREVPVSFDRLAGAPVARPGGEGLGALVVDGGGVTFREFGPKPSRGGSRYEEAEGLVFSADGRVHAYAARIGLRWFVVVDGVAGPAFDRVVTPILNPDGKAVVYRARKNGVRFVVSSDAVGGHVRRLPPYEQVFPVRLAAGDKPIRYGVKQGRRLIWREDSL